MLRAEVSRSRSMSPSSLSYSRLVQVIAALGIVGGAIAYAGCGSDHPPPLACDTKAETRSYFLNSGCGTGGLLDVSTTVGSCAVSADGGYAAQVPSTGQFVGQGADGQFTLEGGNWELTGTVRIAFHPPMDDAVTCVVKPAASDGTQAVGCSTTICADDGEDSSCEEQLCNAILFPPDAVPANADDVGGGLGLGDAG